MIAFKLSYGLLEAEQTRIENERADARRWAEAATHDATEIVQALDEALALLNNAAVRYREASEEVRRLINQALFEKLYVRDDEVNDAEPIAWVRHIHNAAICQEGRKHNHGPFSGAVGFHKGQMVPEEGLEPPTRGL